MIKSKDIQYVNTCDSPLALCNSSNKEKFWMDDITELYKNNNYLKFVPQYKMSKNEQLNTISRLCIYMIIIMLLFGRREMLLFIPITILFIIIMIKWLNLFDDQGPVKELNRVINIRKEDNDALEAAKKIEYAQDGTVKYKSYEQLRDEENAQKDYIVKSGIIDSNGSLRLGQQEYPSTYLTQMEKKNNNYTIDELNDYEKNTCRMPTIDNPLMNPTVLDYGTEFQPEACNADDDDIKNEIRVNFNHELFRDVDELWERQNSQRQFYTMPNTSIPNKQTEFAHWLYRQPDGMRCKDSDMSKCINFYDDVRYRIR